jgi:enterochelin esterase family protein
VTKKFSRVLLAATALAFAVGATARAQPASNATGARQVVSPEVGADKKITYRLYAPNAKSVGLTGDFIAANTRLAKDEASGVWSYTTPAAMPPGIYGYYFSIDGIRFVDPSNLYSFGGAHYLKSYVEVPGDGSEYWAQRDVPHGQLHELWYKNPTLGARHVVVYTPPGYDPAAAKTYPAVYLYSGSGDNEHYWTRIGRAHFVMDNLIADGKAKPAILVMPYGSTVVPSPADGQEDTGGAGVYGVIAIGNDLVGSVIPTVEKNFKVGREPKDRAIFGFSMGGYLAPTIGLNHPELFGWVAGSSADYRNPGGAPANFPGLVAQLELGKKNLRWIGLMVGTDSTDAGHTNASKSAADYLTSLGLNVEWSQPPGGSHTWTSWRGYFRDLMTNKFFTENPSATPKVGMPGK